MSRSSRVRSAAARPTPARRSLTFLLFAGLVLTALVGPAPSARAASAADLEYVASLYADLLDRTEVTVTDPGVVYWAGILESGYSRGDVARFIQGSGDEYYGNVIELSYQRYLDRSADPGGFRYFVDGWRNRTITLETVTAVIVGSTEYYDLHDSDAVQFVDAAYFDILGREADTAGRNYFLYLLPGIGRGGVAGVMATSAENRRAEIRFAFDSYLGRSAGPVEVEAFLAHLQAGVRREELDVALVSSAEYYGNNSG
jgi:hypothetical protein